MLTDTGMPSKVEGFIHLRYHHPSTGGGGKLFFRPSGLLAHYNQQTLSSVDGAQKSIATSF